MDAMGADELADLQIESLLFLPDNTEIWRPELSEDALGPQTSLNQVTVLDVSTFLCRVHDLSGRELERAQRLAAEADVAVTMAFDSPALRGDQLIITNTNTGAVRTVEVLYVPQRSWAVAPRVLCKDLAL